MKNKYILVALFLLIAQNNYSAMVEGRADEIEIDLNNNTVHAQTGIVLEQSNIKTKVHTLQRDTKERMTYYRDGVIAEMSSETGNFKIESQEGKMNAKTKVANFYENFGYLDVSKVTGAEAPNGRIYFGSPEIDYHEDKIILLHPWATTDFKIINHSKNPKEVGYHIVSENIVIEPEKQLTSYDMNFYIGKHKIFPFAFPWFRLNIRPESNVPLFPTWGDEEYYGWNTSWGVLYGNKKSKLKGGIAPKFSEKIGFMIGRGELWYDTQKYGETKFNLTDFVVYSKIKNQKNDIDPVDYEQRYKRYHFEVKHNYDGKYGKFHFNGVNATRSMISPLNDLITKYEANGEFINKAGIQGTGVYLDRPHFDKNIGFYTLDSELSKMGENKDISWQGSLKLTTNKDLYTLSVYDDVENNIFEAKRDHALYTNLALYKDNSKYKIGGYYRYLDDITPGYTTKYKRSSAEDYGFTILNKKAEIGAEYEETRGDQLRTLHFWEIESNAKNLKKQNPMVLPIDYTPVAVSEYLQKDSQKAKISLGKYKQGSYFIRPSLHYDFEEKTLDPLKNESIVVKDNSVTMPNIFVQKNGYDRMQEYNRYQNEVYKKRKEAKANVSITDEKDVLINVFVGKQREKIKARDNQINAFQAPMIIDSKSSFIGVNMERKNISFGKMGTLSLRGDVRYDSYKNKDANSLKWGAGFTHDFVLYDKKDNKWTNHLDVDVQKYHYQGGKEEDKAQNLYTKENSYAIKDMFSWDTKAVHTSYEGEYKVLTNPYHTRDKKEEKIKQKLGFAISEDQKIEFSMDTMNRYTNRIITKEKARKDLSLQNYGTDITYKSHSFGYQRQNMEFQAVDFSKETMVADRYRYSYGWEDKKLSVYYQIGKNKIILDGFHTPEILNIDKQLYGLSFHKIGDVEHKVYLNYENSHHQEESSKVLLNGERENIAHTDSINFSYQYRDKRFKDSEYLSYASLETGKEKEDITQQDIDNIKRILSREESIDDRFELRGIREDAFLFTDNRVNFRFYGTLERNKARYKNTHNFMDSLEKIKGGIFYTYNRYGIGYTLEQNSGWVYNNAKYQWKTKNREHQISFYGKIGKPSNSWRVKTYAKFYENLLDRVNADKQRKKSLDGIGIEIGKEFDYFEWALVYEKSYSLAARDYEWRVGLQFTLLTFPENSIFGIGRQKKSNNTRIKTEFLDSMNIENIVEENLRKQNIMQK